MNERSEITQRSTEPNHMPPGNLSAFPLMPPQSYQGDGSANGYPYPENGLTKRELFAAMAMQSVRTVNPACSSQEVAQSAVADADALLKELAK